MCSIGDPGEDPGTPIRYAIIGYHHFIIVVIIILLAFHQLDMGVD